jgi:hypothetical protein
MPSKISPGCSEHQSSLNWYNSREPEKRSLHRYAVRSRVRHRVQLRTEYTERLADRRRKDYLQAFARLLTSEDKTILREARVTADERATLEQRFHEEAEKWDLETGHLSSPNQRMMHPSYQAILGMGQQHRDEIIGLLIQDMKANRRHWFWALSYLAQTNPIKPEDAGRIDRMIDAWVRWETSRRQP